MPGLYVPVAGSLTVSIYPGIYPITDGYKKYDDVTVVDLTTYVATLTADQAKLVIIVVDNTGAFAVRDGTAITGAPGDDPPVYAYSTLADTNLPILSTGDNCICAVKLYYGQIDLQCSGQRNDFIDMRFAIKSGVSPIDGGDTVVGAANPEIATLMHFTGDNNSTVFTDDNSENSWVQHGTAKIVTGDYKWSPSSALFDDTAACRITTSNSKFNLADHDFTIDFFVKFTAWQSWYNTVCAYGVLSGAPNGWAIIFKSDHMSFFYDVHSYNSYIEIGPKYFNFSLDTWYYIRICRTGGKIYFFANGNLLNTGGTTLTATIAHVSGDDFLIGDIGYGDHYMNLYGHLDEFRVINGTALSTASFSVPTGPGSITDGGPGQVVAKNVIQFRRGLEVNLPASDLDVGEPYFATDTGNLYIGKGIGETPALI